MNPEFYMHRCLELAKKGAGYVAPNPMVGAVLVHDDRIIGEGWHQEYGQDHAEVNCVADAIRNGHEALLTSASMYVSLEPCNHFGKTPPCTELIIRYKIPKLIIGCQDSFEKVDGKGIEKLRVAGVEVITGVLEKECQDINRRFFLFHREKRPYIVLKWAQSANGMIGSGTANRVRISNEFSNRLVHRWRGEEGAILVGTNTALQDDPELTNRYGIGPSPVRIVIDNQLKLPDNLKIFNKASRTIIFNLSREARDGNPEYHQYDGKLTSLLTAIYELGILSVLVEGGAGLLQSFINEGLWDEIRTIENTVMNLEGGLPAPVFKTARVVESVQIEKDLVRYYRSIANL